MDVNLLDRILSSPTCVISLSVIVIVALIILYKASSDEKFDIKEMINVIKTPINLITFSFCLIFLVTIRLLKNLKDNTFQQAIIGIIALIVMGLLSNKLIDMATKFHMGDKLIMTTLEETKKKVEMLERKIDNS